MVFMKRLNEPVLRSWHVPDGEQEALTGCGLAVSLGHQRRPRHRAWGQEGTTWVRAGARSRLPINWLHWFSFKS